MKWEDWPELKTDPYGVMTNGTLVQLVPVEPPTQLQTIADTLLSKVTPSLGTAVQLTNGTVIPDGWQILMSGGNVTLAKGDGEATVTGATSAYPLTLAG